jgi:hypothetical protein
MKNTITQNSTEDFILKEDSWLIKTTLILFLLILNICLFNAQSGSKLKPGFGVELLSSGNGHGAFTSPRLSIKIRTNTFSAGPLIQNCTGTIKGIKLTYSKNLSGTDYDCRLEDYPYSAPDIIQINFFSYLQYIHKTQLCSSIIRTEQMIHSESTMEYNHLKLSTGEAGAGIELRFNLNSTICWRSFIAAAVYDHFSYQKGMDHEKIAPSLNLGTGLQITIQ